MMQVLLQRNETLQLSSSLRSRFEVKRVIETIYTCQVKMYEAYIVHFFRVKLYIFIFKWCVIQCL